MKTCTRCKVEKPLTEYYTENRSLCNDCERETSRERMATLENKARNAYRNAKLTAKKFGVLDDLTEDDVMYLFKLANGRCAYTGKRVPLHRLSLEHVIPMSKGGANTIGNVLVVDIAANLQKRDSSALEYIDSRCNPRDALPLVKLLAARSNRDYRELYDELYAYQRQESQEQYEKLIAKLG